MSQSPGKDPSNEPDDKKGKEEQLSRRDVLKRSFAALLGVAAVGDIATGAKAMNATIDSVKKLLDSRTEDERLKDEAAHEAKKLLEEAERLEHQGMTSERIVNYMGSTLFLQGVFQLSGLPLKTIMDRKFHKDNLHINKYQYAALTTLLGAKYGFTDEEGRELLQEDITGAMKTFGMITGAMTIGEGVNADIAKAWEKAKGKKPQKSDMIALMTTLSMGVSSTATTLVNSGIVRNMAMDLADTGEVDEDNKKVLDPAIMAVCTSHNTNLSGIALFGNPPFMAVAEKYGFKEGISWKIKASLPLALYSWMSSTFKLNLIIAKRSGLTGNEAWKKAAEDTKNGLTKKENIYFFVNMILKSLGNALKYSAGLVGIDAKQSEAGIRFEVGEAIIKKLHAVFVKLPFGAEKLEHGKKSEEPAGLHEVAADAAKGLEELFLEALPSDAAMSLTRDRADADEDFVRKIQETLDSGNDEKITEVGKEHGIPDMGTFKAILKDFRVREKAGEKPDWKKLLNPRQFYNRVTDIERIKSAVGENLGDVVNVFPFQAGCVPFLTPVFKELIDGLGLTGMKKELVIFLLIQVFSTFADNYVACKIGLDLLPDKPEIALIASEHPLHNPVSNMANLGQYKLEDFPLGTALSQWKWHVDNEVVALAWSQVVGMLNKTEKLGFLFKTPPVAKKG